MRHAVSVLGDYWALETRRRPLWLAAAFGADAAWYFMLDEEPSGLTAVAVAGPALLLAFWAHQQTVRAFAIVALMLTAGFAAGQLRVLMVEAPRLSKPAERFTADVCIERLTPRSSHKEIVI